MFNDEAAEIVSIFVEQRKCALQWDPRCVGVRPRESLAGHVDRGLVSVKALEMRLGVTGRLIVNSPPILTPAFVDGRDQAP